MCSDDKVSRIRDLQRKSAEIMQTCRETKSRKREATRVRGKDKRGV